MSGQGKNSGGPPAKNAGRALPRQAQFLSQSTYLEETLPPRAATALIWLLSLLIAGSIIWASLAELKETAIADGEIMPFGSVRVVQHLEGGILRDLLVREGSIVEPGQTLARLDPESSFAELDRIAARRAVLALKAERLRAFVSDREPDFSAYEAQYPGLVRDQREILKVQDKANDRQRDILKDQERALLSDLIGQRKRLKVITDQVALMEKEASLRKDLFSRGLSSRLDYMQAERNANEARAQHEDVRQAIARSTEQIAEARSRLAELDVRLKNEALEEVGVVTGEIAELQSLEAKLKDRLDRLEVTAPVRGVVKQIVIKTQGGVIAPGAVLMEIVPVDDELVANVRISTRDIGRVEIGQSANVKVATYDYSRFGIIDGTVDRISASSFIDENGEPYYQGIIKLQQSHVGKIAGTNPVFPGMTIEVDITTGTRTVISYLLSPLHRLFSGALNEQ